MVLLLGLLLALTPAPALAQPNSCPDALHWTGDEDLIAQTRSSLSRGPLADAPVTACEGVVLELSERGDAFELSVNRRDRRISQVVHDPAAITSWVESWLLPADSFAVAASAETETVPAVVTQASDSERPPVHQAPATQVAAEMSLPVRVALRGGLGLDHVAPAWIDLELELAIGLGPHAWLGLAGSGAWAPEQNEEVRLALRLAARVGFKHAFGDSLLRVGAGIGIVSASARGDLPDDTEVVDDEAGPFVSVFGGYDVPLFDDVALSFGAVFRAHIPDDVFEGSEPTQELDAPEPYEPEPLPVVSATLEVGLSFDAGGAW